MKSIYDELAEKNYDEMVVCLKQLQDVSERNNFRLTNEELLLLLRLEHIVNEYITMIEMKKKEVKRNDI